MLLDEKMFMLDLQLLVFGNIVTEIRYRKALHWQIEYRRQTWFLSSDPNPFSFHSLFSCHTFNMAHLSFLYFCLLNILHPQNNTHTSITFYLQKYNFWVLYLLEQCNLHKWHLFFIIILCSWICESQDNKRPKDMYYRIPLTSVWFLHNGTYVLLCIHFFIDKSLRWYFKLKIFKIFLSGKGSWL